MGVAENEYTNAVLRFYAILGCVEKLLIIG